VLGIHRIGSGRALYYLSDLARELPLPSAPSPGTWTGGAAAAMGLAGPVNPASFEALLEGRHPLTLRRISSGRATVAGLDLTFSAPKSASVLFALGGEDIARRIVAAHTDAVSGAQAYVERHAVAARRRAGAERRVLPTSGVVAGRFTHAVNRNHDPHLHTHVVMANLVHGSDGRWGACDGRGLAAHAAAASAVYDAHLRHELTRTLGVRWSHTPGGRSEIEGVPATLVGEFSSRSAEIRRYRHETGVRSARGGRIAWAVTRPEKDAAPAYDVLAAQWRRRADHADRAEDLSAALPARPHPARATVDEHAFAAVLVPMAHGGAHRRDVVQAFAAAAPDGAPAPWVDQLTASWVREPDTAAVGVAEPLHRRADVLPGGHLLQALGRRPLEPRAHEVWRDAARAIEGYRRRWGLTRAPDAFGLGDPPRQPSTLGAARLADHVRTMYAVDVARARLGRREPPAVELFLGR
jgi:conjugative relaxase-like TrwC/TraI family protein